MLLTAGCKSIPPEQPEPAKVETNNYTSIVGKYSFTYPLEWKVQPTKNSTTNVLIGPEATVSSGLGGIEVFPNQISIEKFLQDSGRSEETSPITIDGITGIQSSYKDVINGRHVVFFKDSKIYNIYINSEASVDIEKFNSIIASFKFN